MRLLLDENLSPRVAAALCTRGVDAIHVRDRGMLASRDDEVLALAFTEDRVLVTSNVADFVRLASACELHAGIVLLEDGSLTRDEQRALLERVRLLLENETAAGRTLINRALRITREGPPTFDELPGG
jgi:predicted nuclease of predicted toxin-antitoxin system